MNGFHDTDMRMPARLSGCFFGGSGGSSSGQQASQQGPVANPAFPALIANAGRATGIAETPFESYNPSSTVAPVNPTLSSSWGLFKNIGANNTGGSTLDSAINNTNAVGGDLSRFMNPFQKNVTDTTMADLERQRQIQRVNDNQSATGASAFGGARQGVADSLTNEASQRTAASTLAGLNFQNFNNVQDVALRSGAQLGQLSDQQLQQAMSRAGAVNTAGTQQRSIDQQQADAAYQEFLRRIGYPIQGQQLINQSLGLLPGGVSQAGSSRGNQNASNFGFSIFGG